MKIEIGESMFLSWLRHIKECQVVQSNWKMSPQWELHNSEVINNVMDYTDKYFREKYNYSIFKQNTSIRQLLKQAEIDVMGIKFQNDSTHIYAIDVAFHEYGLNYGSKDETVARVIKKCIRTAMCIMGCFNTIDGTIIFASPKINKSINEPLHELASDFKSIFQHFDLGFEVQVISNEDFHTKVFTPILDVIGNVADTSELYMRSLQMYNMFAKQNIPKTSTLKPLVSPSNPDIVASHNSDVYSEMKIGAIVRTILKGILQSGKVSNEEITLLQTKDYSRDKFHIQYPLLLKVDAERNNSPKRYYAEPIEIKNQLFYLCSEWFETFANNDRPLLLKWLALHK